MTNRENIEKPVAGEFKQFLDEFNSALHSDVQTIRLAIETVYHSSGKHIRPLLLLLTAKACGGITPSSVQAAVQLEMLHTASLIHDDVVDESMQRRGYPSMNATFDNKIAVLVGDFLLAEVLIRAIQSGNTQIVSIIARLTREMSEGEIKQLENAKEVILNEKDYLVALEKKTAMLLSVCTEIGAITANAPAEMQQQCKEFGQLLGLCFQIRDDIFDYFEDEAIGKPNGNDIREGKVTLPLLYALESTSDAAKAPYLKILHEQDFTPANIKSLIQFAKDNGGIEYAEARMAEYKEKAATIIRSLPNSDAKTSLLLLADYLIERKK